MVSIGRICRQKRFDVLLRAIAVIRDLGIPVRCTIVGGSYEAHHYSELLALTEALQLSPLVTFAGLCTAEEKSAFNEILKDVLPPEVK